jgi:hypothetical protein
MLGDHSRDTASNALRKNYVGVRLKQGAPLLDSAFNEQSVIAHSAVTAVARAALGRWGTPHEDQGFAIAAGGNGGITIGAGAFFVAGEQVRNHAAVGFTDQVIGIGLPSLPQRLQLFGQTGLAFLEVWHETADSLDDPRLKEKALGGVEDSVRTRLRWRVEVTPLVELGITADQVRAARKNCAPLNVVAWLPSTGGLTPSLPVPAVADQNCELPPESGYRSLENQLYCVAIHDSGDRAAATFKWSREGGGIVAALVRDPDNRLVLEGAIDDPHVGFKTGDIVEVVDERSRFAMLPGSLRRLALDPVTGEASFTPAMSNADFNAMAGPKLIRWDLVVAPPALPAAIGVAQPNPIALENGIQVSFSNGTYRTGDHWLIPARAATGDIEWPPSLLAGNNPEGPLGGGRLRAPLALVTRLGGNQGVQIEDVRSIIPALTCLTASDVRVDGTACAFGPQVQTVQDAIDALCRSRGGICTVIVAPGDNVQAAFDRIPPSTDGSVCFMSGDHELPNRILVKDKGRIVVHGEGTMARLNGNYGEKGLLFESCAEVTIRDLAIRVGDPVGPFSGGPDAAIECLNCGPVDIEAVEVKTGSAGSRRIVGIRVAALAPKNKPAEGSSVVCEARIARCTVTGGDWQVGIEVLNPSRVIIEDNIVRPREAGRRFIYDLRLKNRAAVRSMVAAMVRKSAPAARDVGTRVMVSNGTVQARFLSHPDLVDVWKRYEAFAPARFATNPQQLFSHLRNAAELALRNGGVVRSGNQSFNRFDAWVKNVRAASTPTLDGAIVVGGRRIGEARVTGNRVGPAREGISVAASFGTNGIDLSWKQAEPANTVRRAEISGNVVTVPARMGSAAARFGIEVGHFANQLLIEGNEISSPDPGNPDFQKDAGIFVYGWRGPMLGVSGNYVRGFSKGGIFAPQFPAAGKIWKVAGNAMTVAANAPNDFRLADNL